MLQISRYILPVRITMWTWKFCGFIRETPEPEAYRLYRYAFHFLFLVVYLFALVANVFMVNSMKQLVLYIMYLIFTEIVMLLKAWVTYHEFPTVCRLHEMTLDASFQPQDDVEVHLQQRAIRKLYRTYFLYLAGGTCAVISAMLYLSNKAYRLPYFPWFYGITYGESELISFGILFGYQIVGMFIHMLINVSGDAQLIYLFSVIAMQLDFLACRAKRLRTAEDFRKPFVILVKHYERVHRMLLEVEQLYSSAFFAQFAGSSLVICATAYQASSMFNLKELSALQNLMYMIAMMMQMMLPCYFGNEITLKSNLLKTALYSSRWYTIRPAQRKNVLMFLIRTNRPFTAKAYHFFNYNLQAYTTTLNTAYSVYAVLQRTGMKRS